MTEKNEQQTHTAPPCTDNRATRDYIKKRRREQQSGYYEQRDYLAEIATPHNLCDIIAGDAALETLAAQLHYMNNSFHYMMLGTGDTNLPTALNLQRRFCETLKLAQKLKEKSPSPSASS